MTNPVPEFEALVGVGCRANGQMYGPDIVRDILAAVLPLVVGPAVVDLNRAATVYDNFKASEEQGYRSRDRQYAMDMLRRSTTTRDQLARLIQTKEGG